MRYLNTGENKFPLPKNFTLSYATAKDRALKVCDNLVVHCEMVELIKVKQ